MQGWIIFAIVLVVFIAVMVALYFLGKKAQKRKDEQDAQMAAVAQTVSMLIIDKKKINSRILVFHSRLLTRHQNTCVGPSFRS